MPDELLADYQRELTYIRKLADAFAQEHPTEASQLGINEGNIDDPHVERLIEAFAYLTARVRRKIDDEFPELTDGLLDVIFPHYLAPIPSAAIVQFELDQSQGELTTGYEIKRHERVSVSDRSGTSCSYRTCYDTTVWPIHLAHADLQRRPFTDAPEMGASRDALGMLHLKLKCNSNKMTFGGFDAQRFDRLRFYLNGQDHHVMPLYELLMNDAVQIVVTCGDRVDDAIVVGSDAIQPVGFTSKEALYPYPRRSFPGYGLLTEYFAFPWKFLFFDLRQVTSHPRAAESNELNFYIYLDRDAPDLESFVGPSTFCLGCTPIVNLFNRHAEPITIEDYVSEHPIITDPRNPVASEVYSINRVRTASSESKTQEFSPLYSIHTVENGRQSNSYWLSHRRQARNRVGRPLPGSDVYLSLTNRQLAPTDEEVTLMVETTCLNRDLPRDLKSPQAALSSGGPFRSTTVRKGPTTTVRPNHKRRGMWALVSHLTLNHLSIGDSGSEPGEVDREGAAALRGILELYDFDNDKSAQQKIRGITAVHRRSCVDRLPDSPSGFARGVEVTVEFDEDQFKDPGQGLYLFASVIEQFLSMYCSINSFTKMRATTQREGRTIKTWPPNKGERFLL